MSPQPLTRANGSNISTLLLLRRCSAISARSWAWMSRGASITEASMKSGGCRRAARWPTRAGGRSRRADRRARRPIRPRHAAAQRLVEPATGAPSVAQAVASLACTATRVCSRRRCGLSGGVAGAAERDSACISCTGALVSAASGLSVAVARLGIATRAGLRLQHRQLGARGSWAVDCRASACRRARARHPRSVSRSSTEASATGVEVGQRWPGEVGGEVERLGEAQRVDARVHQHGRALRQRVLERAAGAGPAVSRPPACPGASRPRRCARWSAGGCAGR